jgi:hypothetical protein
MDKADARAVANDAELAEGVFRLGERYFVRTPTYHYTGRLTAVTPMVYVLEDCATVFESGPFPAFYASGGVGADVQAHTGAGETLVDRAGAVLTRFLAAKEEAK